MGMSSSDSSGFENCKQYLETFNMVYYKVLFQNEINQFKVFFLVMMDFNQNKPTAIWPKLFGMHNKKFKMIFLNEF